MNANRSPQSLHADCVPISVVLPRNVCSFVNPRRSIWQQREAIGIDTTLHSGHDTRVRIFKNSAFHFTDSNRKIRQRGCAKKIKGIIKN